MTCIICEGERFCQFLLPFAFFHIQSVVEILVTSADIYLETVLDKSGSLFTYIYQHCRILVLMVNWWSIMLALWHGADTHVSAYSTLLIV